MTQARQQRDQKDMQTLLKFLEDRKPFSEDKCLRNIASGETADTSVNADHAVEVGQKIVDAMNGENVLTFSFKKKDQVVTLSAKSAVKVDGELFQVDPQLLFQRLIATAETFDGSLAAVFKYELCSVPPALFDSSGLPREANKPALADALWTLMKNPDVEGPVQDETHYVLDGGALLQRVIWTRGATYDAIIQLHTDYVSRKYGTATIVFDGYDNDPSKKYITHLRRKQGVGSKVNFTGTMLLCSKKEEFLANETNKQRFIHMLGDALEDIGCKITHATGDADALIVQKAVESATDTVTVLIGEDTDLLVLLCYHASFDSHDVFFMSEQKMSVKKKRKIWNIKEVKRTLGTDICNAILFAHAILGCDTTSRVFGIGKGVALKKLKSEAQFRALAAMFHKTSTKEEVIAAGEQAMVTLYQGESGVGLDNLRHRRFCEKVAASKSFVQPKPSSDFSSSTVSFLTCVLPGERLDRRQTR